MNNTFLDTIISGTLSTCRRFVLPVIVAVVGTVAALMLAHISDDEFLAQILVTVTLSFPITLAATIFAERASSRVYKILIFLASIAFILFYHFFYGERIIGQYEMYIYRHILWFVAAISLVAFAPFIKQVSTNVLDFWNYNKRIAYALIATFIYSAAIQIGLSIALLATNFLFDLNLSSYWWSDLMTIVAGLFAPVFFLSRFPRTDVSEEVVYPKELRLFSFYIPAPLVCIYFIILYAYTAKILLTQEWPNGTVSYLILGFSALGVLTYAIVYPLALVQNAVKVVSKIFFAALIPQVAVLFWAVWLRVSDYGITEKRYLLIIGGLWLLSIALYYLASQAKRLRIIPISLFVAFVAISFGPWGMFSVSERSQINRLESILERNGVLVDGSIVPASGTVNAEDSEEVSEVLRFLYNTYGFQGIDEWFKENLSELHEGTCVDSECYPPRYIMNLMGITYDEFASRYESGVYIRRESPGLVISGYDYHVNSYDNLDVDGNTYQFMSSLDVKAYEVRRNDVVVATIPVEEFYNKLFGMYEQDKSRKFSQDDMSVVYEDEFMKVKIVFNTVNGTRENVWSSGDVLASFK